MNRLPAQKLDDAQEEERLEDQLDYLNALHVQVRTIQGMSRIYLTSSATEPPRRPSARNSAPGFKPHFA